MLLALVLLAAPALSDEVPKLQDPLPFRHADHERVFEKSGLTCISCHPVGLAVMSDQVRVAAEALPPPKSACHACHRGEVKGAPKQSPSACMTCHADALQLRPADHGAGWVEQHGPEARVRGNTCNDCHKPTVCIDCHEARGPMVRSPHSPGFAAAHGVQARLDPFACATCHAGETCTTCHTKGVVPW